MSLFLTRYIKAHHISHAALVMGGLTAAVLFFAVGAAIRLLIGPVSLGPFGGALSGAIARALPGITVQYDQAAIEWSRDEGRVNLVILGARVFDAEGRIIAQAPEADIDLAAGPLFRGNAVVRRITLVGVQLTLVRNAQGGLRLGVEKDKSQHDILSRITDAIRLRSDKSSSLQSFAIHNARLAFYDEPSGLFLVAPRADFRVATAGADLKASLDAALEISGHPAHVTGEFTVPTGNGAVSGAVAITGLDLRALGSDSKTFASVKGLGLVVDMSASFVVRGVHLVSADFGIGAKGSLDVPGLIHGPLKVKTLELTGRYDGATGRVLIDDGTLLAGGTCAHLTASGDLFYDETGALERVGFQSSLDKIALVMPGVLSGPVALRIAAVRGSYLTATKDIIVDHAEISGSPLSAQASGKITLVSGQAPAIDLKGGIAALSMRDLLRYWPMGVGAGARDWVDKNMPAGMAGPVAFEAHMPAGMLDASALPDGALKITIPVSGADANYINGLTHLTQLKGVATLTGDTFDADIASARVGPLVVTHAHAVITNLHMSDAPGEFTARVEGSMPDILALVDMKPLNYPTRFGVDAKQTKGTAALDLAFHLPMRKNLNVDDVNISVKAAVSGFSIALGDHARLSEGDVNFTIDNTKLHAAGTAMLADSKLTFDWSEDFRTANPITTLISVKGTLDDGGRAALNFPSSGFLKGPATISAELKGHRGSLTTADMTMDLTPATISLDLIGVNKPPGFATSAHITAAFGPATVIRSETMKFSGPGIAVSGSATFDKAGHMTVLDVPVLRVGAGDDLSLTVTRGVSGLDIAVHGHSADGSRLASRGSGGAGTGVGTGTSDETTIDGPFHISAKLDRLMLREGISISPFALDVSGVGNRPSTLTLSGTLSKSATIAGNITATDAGRHLTFSTGDAGLLAKGLFGFTSLRGGSVDFTATLPGKATDTAPKAANLADYQAKLTMRDFKILNQPFLTRLFSAGSLDGLINLMQGQGIAVDKLEVPFSSRNGVLDVHDARATGPAIGLTADGYIDRPKNGIALKGSLVPVFGLNSVLGAIPVIGNVLVSKQGEGVFGMTYSVSGNADQPNVSVNPLAVLTPGILRRVFQGKMPNAAQAPSNAQPAPAPAPTPPKP